MTLDFESKQDYDKFVSDISSCILSDYIFQDELEDDIAQSIVERHLQELSAAVVDRLIEQKMREQIQNENPRQQENA